MPLKPLRAFLASACALVTCFGCSPACAQDAAPDQPQPHWSPLPIWGVDAEARGFQLPLPFGVGFNYYREQQPFNINDLQVSRGGAAVSINDFVGLHQVE